MSERKKYDRWGIEITRWNGSNIVAAIDCDCGQLAQNVRGKLELFECADCGHCYHKERGEYVVKKRNGKRRIRVMYRLLSLEKSRYITSHKRMYRKV